MSNWVISTNIKQLVLEKKKKDTLRDAAFQHQETVRKPWTKKRDILLLPELTYVAMLTMITKYQKWGSCQHYLSPCLAASQLCTGRIYWVRKQRAGSPMAALPPDAICLHSRSTLSQAPSCSECKTSS